MARRTFDRRDFIRIIAASTVASGLGASLAACDDDSTTPANMGAEPDMGADAGSDMGVMPTAADVFPQGLASGDPKPDSVILWTRALPEDLADSVDVLLEVASDEAFETIVVSETLSAAPATDHTVRAKITELSAYTHYWYRFTAREVTSVTGRTKTSPAADQDVPVSLAVASCQDYNGRYYHSWQVLAEQDADIDYVVFLGDYIYETAGDARFQDQEGRQVGLPDGLEISETGRAALTLADYRSLYQQYRSDPKLQRVHQLYPFMAIWDDHEFADDCWQDHSTHFNEEQGDEASPERRKSANQAWFEYMPADVTHNPDAAFPDDLRITRSFRLGLHCELFLTDQRSFRSDHVVPEGPPEVTVGKLNVNSAIGARQFTLKSGFDALEAEANPTMLGAEQKTWLVDGINASTATWKVWGSEVQVAQQLVDLSRFESLPENYRGTFYLSCDQWDGYRTERAEILQATAATENMVVLTGDIHAFYASELYTDFDAPTEPVAVEMITAGISSKSYQEIILQTLQGDETLSGLGLADIAEDMDAELQMANPHVKLAQSTAYGYLRVNITAEQVEGVFVRVSGVENEAFGGEVTRRTLRCASGSNRLLEA